MSLLATDVKINSLMSTDLLVNLEGVSTAMFLQVVQERFTDAEILGLFDRETIEGYLEAKVDI